MTLTTTTTGDATLPACFVLLPGWIGQRGADRLLGSLTATVPWEQTSTTLYGRTYPTPRLTCWVGEGTYSYSGVQNEARDWLPDMDRLRDRLEATSSARYNSCLANLYRGGSDTVGWHQDNERGLDPRDPIASISLGAGRDFRIREISTKQTWTVPLRHGDLLLMLGPDSQTRYQHSVPRRARVLGVRINLTYRIYQPGT